MPLHLATLHLLQVECIIGTEPKFWLTWFQLTKSMQRWHAGLPIQPENALSLKVGCETIMAILLSLCSSAIWLLRYSTFLIEELKCPPDYHSPAQWDPLQIAVAMNHSQHLQKYSVTPYIYSFMVLHLWYIDQGPKHPISIQWTTTFHLPYHTTAPWSQRCFSGMWFNCVNMASHFIHRLYLTHLVVTKI